LVDFSLYLITDRTQTAGRTLPAVVADALRGGLRAVQLREKDLDGCQLFELARELRCLTREFGAQLLINERIDIALAVGADGVHLGRGSLPVAVARRILGSTQLVGYSAHGLDEARQAERDGADFITFGPIYDTPSKISYGEPQGLERLAEVVRNIAIPVFALGGVKVLSADAVLSAGARGIALISAIIAAQDPTTETETFLKIIARHDNIS
jgi:thiamine-phosphate pyrophosphorylase